jgi:CubicO group peptidase (beta-lactamase class C family)
MLRRIAAIALTVLAASVTKAQPPAVDARAARVDSLMAALIDAGDPGAAVAVIRNGAVIHQKGYGLADRQTKRPITASTTFDLASVSKQFTALAIMMLAERKQISYDDPLTRFFPEFPPYATKITVRHLLTHTSGIADYMEVYEKRHASSRKEPTSQEARLMLAEISEPRFEPGAKFEYSNSGYMVLAQIVEKASGQVFPVFMKNNVFVPLGMSSTVVSDQIIAPAPDRAISYASSWLGYRVADYSPLNRIYGDGNVNTSTDDMFKWDQALYTDQLVKQSTLAEAFTPVKLNDGSSAPYGFGWRVVDANGLKMLSHGGSWVGFRAHIVRIPSERFSVVVLSNRGNFNSRLAAVRIANIYLGGKLPE